MKINKLNDDFFLDFISQKLELNVRLYKHDLQITRTESAIKVKFYMGGESEDERRFAFKDEKCIFTSNLHNQPPQDISYEWVTYVLEYADELTEPERKEIVEAYNRNIELDINRYVSQKREAMIVS